MFRGIAILAFAFAVGGGAAAQAPPATPAEALRPFQVLVGTWSLETEAMSWERTCRLVLGGKFLYCGDRILLKQIANPAPLWQESWIGYDPARKRVVEWGFHVNGSYSELEHATTSDEGIIMEERRAGPEGKPRLVRHSLRRTGDDGLVITIRVVGATSPSAVHTFVRKSAAAIPFPPTEESAASASLRPLGMLVGRWGVDGESDGAKYSVDYEVYWTLGGHFLRSDYSVTTNAQKETHAVAYMFFDAETKSLRQIGFSAEGSVGSMKVSAAETSVTFDGEMLTPARNVRMRITYSRAGADTLTAVTESQRQDGSWRRSPASPFQRRP